MADAGAQQLVGSLLHGSGRVLLVCADDCDDVRKSLEKSGCSIATVTDGKGAVARATREFFDVAVLLSTGREMDLAETVLNLRDISGSMHIVVIADRVGTGRGVITNLIHAVPSMAVLTLQSLLDSLKRGSRR